MAVQQLPCPAPSHRRLLTPAEAAQRLGLKSHHTLEVWRCTKRYPELEYIRVGRLIRYREEAVEHFLNMHTVGKQDR